MLRDGSRLLPSRYWNCSSIGAPAREVFDIRIEVAVVDRRQSKRVLFSMITNQAKCTIPDSASDCRQRGHPPESALLDPGVFLYRLLDRQDDEQRLLVQTAVTLVAQLVRPGHGAPDLLQWGRLTALGFDLIVGFGRLVVRVGNVGWIFWANPGSSSTCRTTS